ncbi:MAG: hypothetical protein ACKOET_12975, partial [Verrucomicrobiota bacterium]
MKPSSRILGLLSLAAILTLGPAPLTAQEAGGDQNSPPQGRRNRGGGPGGGPGNWDPEQMRQRMMERYREQLGVKDDAEWKLISERIEKVNEVRRDTLRGGLGMMFGGRGGPGGPGGPGGGGGRGWGGEPNPDADALQKAIEANAPADEIKAKLAKYRASVKARDEKLAKAQDDLKEVLSLKQEAQAVLMGLL